MSFNYLYPNEFESERLTTRRITINDKDIWTKFLADPDCVKYFPTVGDITPEARSQMWIDRQLDRYNNEKYGLVWLIDKSTNEYIGQCGLLLQIVDGVRELEVGYHLFKTHWGKGYATEAATMFKNFAFENNLTDSIISLIHIDNIPSQRVAERHGLKRDKQTKWFDLDMFVYRQTKIEWKKSKD